MLIVLVGTEILWIRRRGIPRISTGNARKGEICRTTSSPAPANAAKAGDVTPEM